MPHLPVVESRAYDQLDLGTDARERHGVKRRAQGSAQGNTGRHSGSARTNAEIVGKLFGLGVGRTGSHGTVNTRSACLVGDGPEDGIGGQGGREEEGDGDGEVEFHCVFSVKKTEVVDPVMKG